MIFTDIKRYDLDSSFLHKTAKTAIEQLGWALKEETDSELAVGIPRVNGYPEVVLTINIRNGYLSFACGTDVLAIGSPDGRLVVNQFIQALEQQINDAPEDQRQSRKAAYGLRSK